MISSGFVATVYACQIPQNETDDVQIHVNESAVQIYPNELPPDDRKEYEFKPRPCLYMPPVGSSHFTHLINHPDHIGLYNNIVLDMVPKLRSSPVKDPEVVWGICLVEQISFIASLTIFGSMICALFSGIMFAVLLDRPFALWICLGVFLGLSYFFYLTILQLYPPDRLFNYERLLKRKLKPQNKGSLATDKGMRWDRKGLLSLMQGLHFIPVYCVPRLRSCFALWQNAVDSITPGPKDNLSLPDGGGPKIRCVSIWKKDSYTRSRLR